MNRLSSLRTLALLLAVVFMLLPIWSLAAADASDELFTRLAIPRIEVEIPDDALAILRKYNWRASREESPREDVRATVREGSVVYTNVAVHLKGSAGSFRPIDSEKPALTLNFDKFAKGQRFHGLQKLHLNNSVQDPSFVSEIVCRELFAKAGIPVPRASHIVVDLNGRGPLLYVLVEGWNKQFLKRHFKNTKGNLYDGGAAKDISSPIEVQSGENPEDRTRLKDLLAASRETNATRRVERLGQVLDIDQFLSFTAMEVLTVHWDGYARNRNNYRIFHDLESDRMVFLPHGLDQMFGMWRATPQDELTPMAKGLVARAVLGDRTLRRRYLERAAVLFTNVFDFAAITSRVHHLSRRVQPHLLPNLMALANQDRASAWFLERIEQRMESVREQLREALQEPVTALRFGADGTALLPTWQQSTESGNPTFQRRRSGENETLKISADQGYVFGSWRTRVLLDEGKYRFSGRVKTDRLSTNNVPRGGVTLRVSGEREVTMTAEARDWTMLTYDFEIQGLLDTELVCELRASRGSAMFDLGSLRLTRVNSKSGPR
jgi:spore coat protein H